jgi:peptidyl-prolyl cis-trans isomerase SurA
MQKRVHVPLLTATVLSAWLSGVAAEAQKPSKGVVSVPAVAQSDAGEPVLEAVVASVDEKPITLLDVCQRLPGKPRLALTDAAKSVEFKQMLETIVLETLVEEESKVRRLDVGDPEVEQYIDEVARRNNLERSGFESALTSEGKDLAEYKKQVRFEILKSKLLSSSIRGAVAVSEEEVDRHLADQPASHAPTGNTVTLRQILVKTESRSEVEALARATELRQKIEDGESFQEVAQSYSEGTDAAEGGLVGTVAEKDLSSEIFDAVFSLQTGETSPPVKTALGYQIFHVDSRTSTNDEDEDDIEEAEQKRKTALRDEARKVLMERKAQEKMSSYFLHDLYKAHSVDKKI